jgi:hypothetical protein
MLAVDVKGGAAGNKDFKIGSHGEEICNKRSG